jgi:hypothetical protein
VVPGRLGILKTEARRSRGSALPLTGVFVVTDENPNQPLPFDPQFLAKRAIEKQRSRRPPPPGTGPRSAIGAPGYLSVRRAAEVLALRPRSVIYLLGKGRLTSQRLGRVHFIPIAEVIRYRRVRRERTSKAKRRHSRTRRIKLLTPSP